MSDQVPARRITLSKEERVKLGFALGYASAITKGRNVDVSEDLKRLLDILLALENGAVVERAP